MRIQVNSDKNIAVDAPFGRFISLEVNRALRRFVGHLTRVELHLSDVNSHKRGGRDKRCMIEVRPAGHPPIATIHAATTSETAVRGALAKMRNALQTFYGRLEQRARIAARRRAPVRRTAKTATARRAASKRTAAKRAAVKRASARRPATKASLNGHMSIARRKTATAKTATARKRAAAPARRTKTRVISSRGPKRKAIYQARRRYWPRAA